MTLQPVTGKSEKSPSIEEDLSFKERVVESIPVDAPFVWTVHLASERPGRAVAAGGICILAGLLAGIAFRHPLVAVLVSGALFSSLADFFLPVHYRLTQQGAEARHLWTFARIEWKQVKRRLMSNEGIKLSPLGRPTRREPYRGVLLRFGDQDPDALLERVRTLHERAKVG